MERFCEPTVGVMDIVSRGRDEYLFIHVASYLGRGEADRIEAMGRWLIAAAERLRAGQGSGSHRDR